MPPAAVPEDAALPAVLEALTPFLRKGGHGLGHVYRDLCGIAATWHAAARRGVFTIPRDNRALVEAATHPEALDRVAAAGGAAWTEHRKDLVGSAAAQKSVAALALLHDSVPFTDESRLHLICGMLDETLATRLGTRDALIHLDPPLPSPFAESPPVTALKIPAHFLGDADRPETLSPDGSTLRLPNGAKEPTLRYDAHGLHPPDG